MGNLLTNDRAAAPPLQLSNGATSVLISVLLLAGSELAGSPWERALVVWLAEHDQNVIGLGVVGFDVAEIAWTRAGFDAQKAFVLRVIDLAAARFGWDRLGYDPPFVAAQLVAFRALVDAFRVEHVEEHPWDFVAIDGPGDATARCPRHGVLLHRLDVDPARCCHLCNDDPSS